MAKINELFQTADWKAEKHAPVIEAPESVKKGEFFDVTVSIGKEIPHPNKTEHHIRWITVFFKPDDDKFPYQIGRYEFNAHGESAKGPDTSTIYSHPKVALSFKTEKSGSILATSYCNIHGLWDSSKNIAVE